MIPAWEHIWNMAGMDQHVALYVDDALNVEMAICTPVRANGDMGKTRVRYAIRGVRKVFLTEDALVDELERRAGGSILIDDCCPHCGTDLTRTSHD